MSYSVHINEINELACLRELTSDFHNGYFNHHMLKGKIEQKYLGDGLTVIKYEVLTKDDVEIFTKETIEFSNFFFTNYLSGKVLQKSNINKSEITHEKNQIHIGYISEMEGSESIPANTHLQAVILLVKDDFMAQFSNPKICSSFLNSKTMSMDSFSCNFSKLAFNSDFDEPMDMLLLKGKSLEYMYYQIEALSKTESKNRVKLDNYDIRALEKAKKILARDLIDPPSLKKLSRMVGLNEFKLKVGFKMIFFQTPYAFLLDLKMQKAKELLNSNDYNVNEVSKLIGYKHHANFTKAFLRHYGFCPKDIRKYS